MQNRPSDYTIEYSPCHLPSRFPISGMPSQKHSPSTNDVSFMHFHNHLELGYCYEGCGIFFVNDKVIPFSAGDVSIIFPNDVHIARSDRESPSQWHFIMLDPINLLSDIGIDYMDLIVQASRGSRSFQNIIGSNNESKIPGLILDIITELEREEKNFRQVVKSMVWCLTLKISRLIELNDNDTNQASDYSVISRVLPALNHIHKHYMEPVSIGLLSKLCSLSVTHFRRLFTLAMGVAPSEYIYTVRIKMASNMVLNSLSSITEISMKVGYDSITSFNRHFKKVMGASPREWKRNRLSCKSV